MSGIFFPKPTSPFLKIPIKETFQLLNLIIQSNKIVLLPVVVIIIVIISKLISINIISGLQVIIDLDNGTLISHGSVKSRAYGYKLHFSKIT